MRSVLTIMVAAILGACSPQFADRPDGDPVNASVRDLVVPDGENDVFLTLPANPWKAADPINIAQQVSATWTDPEAAETKERTTFIARIAITTNHVMVAVLDGLGRRALDIDWMDNALNVTRADWLPDRIDARRLQIAVSTQPPQQGVYTQGCPRSPGIGQLLTGEEVEGVLRAVTLARRVDGSAPGKLRRQKAVVD